MDRSLDSPVTTRQPFMAEYPLPPGHGFCVLLHHFLSQQECADYIQLAERQGFSSAESDYPPTYRNNDRLVVKHPALASQLFIRLQSVLTQVSPAVVNDGGWQLQGINEQLRFCRYGPQQAFNIHQDGVHYREDDCQSRLTFMIYLTDGSQFEGGDTLFYAGGPGEALAGESLPPLIARIPPRAGTLILFDHGLWHAGDSVSSGTKYILRSDLLYRRTIASSDQNDAPFHPPHLGYVWTLAALPDGQIASGGRDTLIRLWDRTGNSEGVLEGHSQSVLDLCVTQDGKLVSVSRDRTLRIWDIGSRRCDMMIVAHQAAILSVVALSRLRLATGGADHLIKLWDKSGKWIGSLHGHRGWVWSLLVAGDDTLVSASEDGTLGVWDLNSGERIGVLQHDAALRAAALEPETGMLAAGDVLGWVTIWSGSGSHAAPTQRFQAHTAALRSLCFIDRNHLATTGEDNYVRIWNLGERRLCHEASHANFVTDFLWLGAEQYVSCAYDGDIVRR